MNDILVKRLRDWEHVWLQDLDEPEGGLYLTAADRIEELETQLSEARQVGKEWFEEQKKAWKDANAAEAKLAEAMKLAEEALYLDGDRDVCAAWCSLWERLEELKGQDDE